MYECKIFCPAAERKDTVDTVQLGSYLRSDNFYQFFSVKNGDGKKQPRCV